MALGVMVGVLVTLDSARAGWAGVLAAFGLLAAGRGSGQPQLTVIVNGRPVRDRLLVAAVRRVLRIKFHLGLFDDPYRYSDTEREARWGKRRSGSRAAVEGCLARLGATMDDVVKCTVFLADIDEWAAMNEVYVTYFPNHKPARSALGVSGLALGARTEIECIAAMPD